MEKIVINEVMLNLFFKLKTKMDYKVMMVLLDKKCTEEESITSQLKISMKTLQKSLNRLMVLELIKRLRHKKNHHVYVTLNRRFFTAEYCQDCKYKHMSSDNKIILCGMEMPCLHDYERLIHGITKIMKDDYEEVGALDNLRGKIGKGGETKEDIGEWGYKDFTLFYVSQFKIHFPNAVEQTDMVSIRWNIKKLMKLVRDWVKNDRWRYVVKHWIARCMNLCEYNKVLINPTTLLEPFPLRKFLDGKGLKISSLEYCKTFDLFCSYAKDGGCELEKSNTSCDRELVERMKERYN